MLENINLFAKDKDSIFNQNKVICQGKKCDLILLFYNINRGKYFFVGLLRGKQKLCGLNDEMVKTAFIVLLRVSCASHILSLYEHNY